MFKAILYFTSLIVVASSMVISPKRPNNLATCSFPNGTDTAMHFYNCDGTYAITVQSARALDANNNTLYPIDPRKPITIELKATNNGVQYNDNKNNVTIYEYKNDWVTNQCQWNSVPTFNLLDAIDGCDYAHNCPLTTGALDLRLPLDLSKFSAIINLLASGTPYQLLIEMHNYNQNDQQHEVIACVVAQIRFEETN
uniref:MD-2-related lipid-recognition domain-containing protein n=1 Tax=Acrobeloides nanus TaxID=290746 RepID=A0A914E0S3_9BILA